jgi:hypothetical protein
VQNHDFPLDDLGELAEEEMGEKREELGNEEQVRELYDLPSESAADLEAKQDEESRD